VTDSDIHRWTDIRNAATAVTSLASMVLAAHASGHVEVVDYRQRMFDEAMARLEGLTEGENWGSRTPRRPSFDPSEFVVPVGQGMHSRADLGLPEPLTKGELGKIRRALLEPQGEPLWGPGAADIMRAAVGEPTTKGFVRGEGALPTIPPPPAPKPNDV
jgi:hypothetical protein